MTNLPEKKAVLIHIILIIVMGFIVYSSSLNGKFVWDDFGLVKDNAYIKSWSNIPGIITRDIGAGSKSSSNFYRPLQMISYTIDYSLWKLNVFGYHLTSTLLHVLAALALYWLTNKIFSNRGISFIAAVLFVIHPVHTEAVSYIAGRADSQAALFILLSLVFYIKSLSSPSRKPYFLAAFSCILALLSKESSVIIPVLILLYHYTFRRKLEIKRFLPILLIVAGYIVLRFTVLRYLIPASPPPIVLLQRIPGFFAALTEYLRLLLLPFNLRLEYGNKLFSFFDFRVVMGLAAAILLIILAFQKRGKNKLVFFSISWFFITLLPVSNIYTINYSFMMEHWLYLPSIGFFLILSSGLCSLCSSRKFRYAAMVLTIGVLFFYSYLTIEQNNYWREPASLYKRTLKFAPDSWRFYNELGLEYADMKLYKQAIATYKKALEINPGLAGVYYNLGTSYSATGNNEEAILSFKKAIELAPRYIEAYLALGRIYCRINKKEEAVSLYKKLIEIEPGITSARSDSPCLHFR